MLSFINLSDCNSEEELFHALKQLGAPDLLVVHMHWYVRLTAIVTDLGQLVDDEEVDDTSEDPDREQLCEAFLWFLQQFELFASSQRISTLASYTIKRIEAERVPHCLEDIIDWIQLTVRDVPPLIKRAVREYGFFEPQVVITLANPFMQRVDELYPPPKGQHQPLSLIDSSDDADEDPKGNRELEACSHALPTTVLS